ncbi:hypothetical protein E3T49_06395 [Cryobacterium cryoconiti]|uniref:DUF5671 domain-containing protein n=1 Tax=Cryobacterium cryoconiti TaxID=1259239 RepID=A0A4Y8JVB4_9MICO|nr:hypothetical protein E3T49_06395 [Cryobacterium cryoconiti]
MVAVRRSSPHGEGTAQPTARRVIVFILLFALVVIAAIGLSGLLGRLLDSGNELVSGDVTGLARSLAFTLIAGPFAAVLWWVLWRRMDSTERSSIAWGLYLAAMYTVSLVTFSVSLLTAAAVLVRDDWQPRLIATGVVWAGVWVWHLWMSRHPQKSPTQLRSVAPVLATVFGLVIAVGGAVAALSSLLDAALDALASSLTLGEPWWTLTFQALIWCGGGSLIWWWHWIRGAARDIRGGLAELALVAVGVAGAAVLTLVGSGTVLFVLLRLAVDRTDPINDLLDLLGFGLSAATIGALVWRYHRTLVRRRSEATKLASKLVTSGLGLVAAASGLGVVVNAILAATIAPLAGSDTRTLLLGGISALVVGGPVWWAAWRPALPVEPAEVRSTGRRVYLILVFGVSAVVAIVTLLVIGYRLFEFALADVTGGSLVDRVRAPLGLLVATGLAAGYHFAVWRRDRSTLGEAPQPARTIARVILVTDAEPQPLIQSIHEVTGASVSVLRRSDAAGSSVSADQLGQALQGVTGKRVLVVTGPGDRVEVIPLQE